jgi:hypothetical protein
LASKSVNEASWLVATRTTDPPGSGTPATYAAGLNVPVVELGTVAVAPGVVPVATGAVAVAAGAAAG